MFANCCGNHRSESLNAEFAAKFWNLHHYSLFLHPLTLQGMVQFPIGGTVREVLATRIRCNSGTDSIVWMEEEYQGHLSSGQMSSLIFLFRPWSIYLLTTHYILYDQG